MIYEIILYRGEIGLFALKYKEVGLKIAYYRKKKGYTQTQLAEMVGISSNYLSLIERGNYGNSYSMETLFKIANALDVDVCVLVSKL